MPLHTQIIRNGETLKLRWGDFHIAAMVMTAALDSGTGPWLNNSFQGMEGRERPAEWHSVKDCPELKQGEDDLYTCSGCGKSFPIVVPLSIQRIMGYGQIGATPLNDGKYTLKDYYQLVDQRDGEILELFPGDELVAYRS